MDCREREEGINIGNEHSLWGTFFFETCQTNQAQHAFFLIGALCFLVFSSAFSLAFWIDDGTPRLHLQ